LELWAAIIRQWTETLSFDAVVDKFGNWPAAARKFFCALNAGLKPRSPTGKSTARSFAALWMTIWKGGAPLGGAGL